MASASEQLAQNLSFGTFGKAKELQKRLLFTIMILIVYRIGTFIPVPGVDMAAYSQVFTTGGQAGGGAGLLTRVTMFAGGSGEAMATFR